MAKPKLTEHQLRVLIEYKAIEAPNVPSTEGLAEHIKVRGWSYELTGGEGGPSTATVHVAGKPYEGHGDEPNVALCGAVCMALVACAPKQGGLFKEGGVSSVTLAGGGKEVTLTRTRQEIAADLAAMSH